MTGSDLAFYTTQELIAEIMSRQTFYGVIVHAEGDHKRDDWPCERMFKVHVHRHLDAARASRLLGSVAEYMNVHDAE
jgi:hypothetical protein